MSTTFDKRKQQRVRLGLHTLGALAMVLPALTWAQGAGSMAASPMPSSVVQPAAGQRSLTLPELQERLAVAGPQLPLWVEFETRVNAYLALYYREKPVQPSVDMVVTQQLARWLGQQQNRLAALEEIEVAVRVLYASLDPAQQQVANQFLLGTLPGFSPPASGPAVAQEPRRKPGSGGGRGRGMGAGL